MKSKWWRKNSFAPFLRDLRISALPHFGQTVGRPLKSTSFIFPLSRLAAVSRLAGDERGGSGD